MASKKLPWMKFYPADWRKDPELRRCSMAARGVWIDMMCIAFECSDRGVLASQGVPWTRREIADAIGGDIATILGHIEELLRKGVARLDESGAIYSKRMVADEHKAQLCSNAGKSGGGNPTFKGQSKGDDKGESQSGLNSSLTSDSDISEKFAGEEEDKKNPPAPGDITAGYLARVWCFCLTRKFGIGKPADREEDMAKSFAEMIRQHHDPATLLAEIERPDRDRNEYFSEFRKRMNDQKGKTNERTQHRYRPGMDG